MIFFVDDRVVVKAASGVTEWIVALPIDAAGNQDDDQESQTAYMDLDAARGDIATRRRSLRLALVDGTWRVTGGRRAGTVLALDEDVKVNLVRGGTVLVPRAE